MQEIRVLLLVTGISLFVVGCSKSEETPKENINQALVKAQKKAELIEAWRKVVLDLSDYYYEYYKVISSPINDSFFDLNDSEFNVIEALVELNDLSRDIIYAKNELTFYILRNYETLMFNIENNDSEGATEAAQLLEEFSSESGFPENIEEIEEMAKQRHSEIEKQKTRVIKYRSSL